MEVFMAVAELRQVTAAAEALGMTQSAASQHVKNLETAFQVKLLDRSTRPVALTYAGEALQRRAYRILNEVEDLKSDLRRLSATTIPILRIGLLASIATTLTPGLSQFVRRDLEIPELSLSAGLASDHQTALHARRVDLAITSEPLFDMSGFDSHFILQEPFFLVLPESYDGPTGDIRALSDRLPLVRFSAHTPVGRRTDQHLQRLRLNLPRAMEADRSSMVVSGVTAGRGFAILSPSLLIDAVVEGMKLRIAPLPFASFTRSILLISRHGELADLPERLADYCGRILEKELDRLFPNLPKEIVFNRPTPN
jgi:DNA-binding transcriptional LysR family regulator